MKFWSICASISVTIADIWTKFGTEHKYHTTNTPEWQIHINWKSKMAAAAILNFGKISITSVWIKISCIKLYGKMHHGHAEMTTWLKSRNRKLIRVTSWNECLKHMCVDLSDYNIFETNLVQNTNTKISVFASLKGSVRKLFEGNSKYVVILESGQSDGDCGKVVKHKSNSVIAVRVLARLTLALTGLR